MTDSTKPLTPQERLTASRTALVLHMTRNDVQAQARARETLSIDPEIGREPIAPSPHGARPFGGMSNAARVWWQRQPAYYAYDFARPVLGRFAERNPLKFLAIAAGVGAVAVLAKPWRLVSLGGLAMAAVKSAAVPSVLLAMLSSTSGDGSKDSAGREAP